MGKLLVILVIIFLVIVCLAFVGIFGRFPDEWEWIGVILAGWALAMATPSIFQMFWGRPLVKVEFERETTEGGGAVLLMFLSNPPVQKRILRRLGVRRETVQGLTASFRISELNGGKVLVPVRHPRIYSDDDSSDIGRNRIILPPTYSVAASIIVVRWDVKRNKAFILGDRLRKEYQLGAGYYQADIILFVDGDPQHISRRFVVGKKADDLIWANPS